MRLNKRGAVPLLYLLFIAGVLIGGYFAAKEGWLQAIVNPLAGQPTETLAHLRYYPAVSGATCSDTTPIVTSRVDRTGCSFSNKAGCVGFGADYFVFNQDGNINNDLQKYYRTGVMTSSNSDTSVDYPCANGEAWGSTSRQPVIQLSTKQWILKNYNSDTYYLCPFPASPSFTNSYVTYANNWYGAYNSHTLYTIGSTSSGTIPISNTPHSAYSGKETYTYINQERYVCDASSGDIVLKECNTNNIKETIDCDPSTPCFVAYGDGVSVPSNTLYAQCHGSCKPGSSVCSANKGADSVFYKCDDGAILPTVCAIACDDSLGCTQCSGASTKQCGGPQWQECVGGDWNAMNCGGTGCSNVTSSSGVRECVVDCQELVPDSLSCSYNCVPGSTICGGSDLNNDSVGDTIMKCDAFGQKYVASSTVCTIPPSGGCKYVSASSAVCMDFCEKTPDKCVSGDKNLYACNEVQNRIDAVRCVNSCADNKCTDECSPGQTFCNPSNNHEILRCKTDNVDGYDDDAGHFYDAGNSREYSATCEAECENPTGVSAKCAQVCALSTSRCNGGVPEICNDNGSGVYGWDPKYSYACTFGCDESTFSCKNDCSQINYERCNPSNSTNRQKCVSAAAGNYWSSIGGCSFYCEQLGSVTKCHDECVAGTERCLSQGSKVRQLCTASAYGNYWADIVPSCGGVSVCEYQQGSSTKTQCSVLCTAGTERCNNVTGQPEVCQSVSGENAWVQKFSYTCNYGCNPITRSCADKCSVVGEEVCDSSNTKNRLRCTEHASGDSYDFLSSCSFYCEQSGSVTKCHDECVAGTETCSSTDSLQRELCQSAATGNYYVPISPKCYTGSECEYKSGTTLTQCKQICVENDQRCLGVNDGTPQICKRNEYGVFDWTAKSLSEPNCITECQESGSSPTRNASCARICDTYICEPGGLFGLLNDKLYECRSDGQGKDTAKPSVSCLLACDSSPGQPHCRVLNSCVNRSDGSSFCATNDGVALIGGDYVYQCSDSGQSVQRITYCDPSMTGGCSNGACTSVCTTLQNTCSGNIPHNCKDDGTGLVPGAACTAIGSECFVDAADGLAKCSKICTPNNQWCDGDKRMQCSNNGFEYWQVKDSNNLTLPVCEKGCSVGPAPGGLNFSVCNALCKTSKLSCHDGNLWNCASSGLEWNSLVIDCKDNPCIDFDTTDSVCQQRCVPNNYYCVEGNSHKCSGDGLLLPFNQTCHLFCNDVSGKCEEISAVLDQENFAFTQKVVIPVRVISSISAQPLSATVTLNMYRNTSLIQKLEGQIGDAGTGTFSFNLVTVPGTYTLEILLKRSTSTIVTKTFTITLTKDVKISSQTEKVLFTNKLANSPIIINVKDVNGDAVDVDSFTIQPSTVTWQKTQNVLGQYELVVPSSVGVGQLKLNITPKGKDGTILASESLVFEIKNPSIKVVHTLQSSGKTGATDIIVETFDNQGAKLDVDSVSAIVKYSDGATKAYPLTGYGEGRFIGQLNFESEGQYVVEFKASESGYADSSASATFVASRSGAVNIEGDVITPDSGPTYYVKTYWWIAAIAVGVWFFFFKKKGGRRR